MNVSRHRRQIEKLYTDRATISRMVETTTPWGETITELQEVCRDQPCRLSQRALGTNNQTEAANEIAYETKLFIAPDVEVRQGDEIAVSRAGVVREYTAGEPFLYPTHQEISLQRRERA